MPHSTTLDGGMDVPQASMAVASVAQGQGAEVVALGVVGTRPCDLDTRSRQLHSKRHHLVCVDAAGPCGSGRSRDLPQQGHVCRGVAPSLMPNKAGDRVKTDRRDAVPWARLRRSGDLTPVEVPPGEDDALRDLTRAREEAIGDLTAATCRLTACWRRHDLRETGQATWGPAHLRWRRAGVCPTPAPPIVFPASVRAVHAPTDRLQRLAHALNDQGKAGRLHPVVDAPQAWRGVPWLVAVTTVAARGDLTRVETPRELMRFLGLIPSDEARGERRRQGAITNAGTTHARRALIEGAGASRHPAQVSRHRQLRREQPSKVIQDIRWKAHVRRGQRHRTLIARGKHAPHVVGAMARALVGFLWAMAQQGPVTPDG
jgi:transposase